MFIGQTLPFVTAYVEELDSALRRIAPEAGLSRIQKGWLGFCLVPRFGTMKGNIWCSLIQKKPRYSMAS